MSRQGIKTATNKMRKTSYRGLTKEEKKIIKLLEAKQQAEKDLYGYYGFYATVKRLSNNQVDWNSIPDKILDVFEDSNKAIERFRKLDKKKVRKAINIFHQVQFKTGSY